MSKKILYSRLQTAIYTPRVGDLGNVLPPPNKTLDHLEMTHEDAGISLKFVFKGIKSDLFIPSGNVVFIEYAPEAVKESAKAKKE